MDKFAKSAGKDVKDHAVRLRFQKFKLKFTLELLRFVMALLCCNKLDIQVFTLIIEWLMFENAVLNKELSVPSKPSVLETIHNEELMTEI